MFSCRNFLFITLLSFLLLPYTSPEAITGEEVVKKVTNKVKKVRTLSVNFKRSFYWELTGETNRVKGRLYLKLPHRLRLETEQETIITNGDTMWTYVPEDKQVIISRSREQPNLLLQFLQDAKNYRPRYKGKETVLKHKCYLIQLFPKQKQEEISWIKLWVDRKRWLPVKIVYLDLNGNLTTYLFTEVKTNLDLKDSLFKFKPLKGVEIVNMFATEPDSSDR